MEEKKSQIRSSIRPLFGIGFFNKFLLGCSNNIRGIKGLLNNKGFTLVELIAVIVIIGTLTTVLIVVINPKVQIQRANDGKRKAEMKQIQAAMELYRADNGEYPKFDQGSNPSIYGHSAAKDLDLNINGITYLSTIPVGINTGGNVCRGYLLTNSADKYTLFTILEDATGRDATSAKDPINQVGGTFTTNNITTTVNDGACAGTTYNFWVNNP